MHQTKSKQPCLELAWRLPQIIIFNVWEIQGVQLFYQNEILILSKLVVFKKLAHDIETTFSKNF